MAEIKKEDVELVLSNGKKVLVDLVITGDWYDYNKSEVSDVEIINPAIWKNGDWDKLEESELTPEELADYNAKVWKYAESCSEDFPYLERAICENKKCANY